MLWCLVQTSCVKGSDEESLSRKGYPDEESETAIAKLVEWGYLDDEIYSRISSAP